MKHTITFYTDDNAVKDIRDIRVSFFDQDGKAYVLNAATSKKIEETNNISWRIAARLKELNGGSAYGESNF